LRTYFEHLFSSNFLVPDEYVTVLFDDKNFTRSQKYFWAIACLSEFDDSISDNIKQGDLFFETRIEPISKSPNLHEQLERSRLRETTAKWQIMDIYGKIFSKPFYDSSAENKFRKYLQTPRIIERT
jgi:hypothetical protein